jgi:hypothetical protein
MARVTLLAAVLLVLGRAPIAAQDAGTVKVTAARANVRSEPNDKAPVVAQVTAGTVLPLKAVEGDWFRVQLPQTGAIRVEAYISRKVATPEKPGASPASPAAPAGAKPVASGPPPDPSGVTVAWAAGNQATWLAPRAARVGQLSDRGDTVRAMAAILPPELHAPMDAGPTQVAYVWALDDFAATTAIEDRRPVFVVDFKNVAGVRRDDLVPALVRLAPAAGGRRVVGMVRGRADEVARTTAEWDVMRDFRQDAIKADVKIVEPGAARITPAVDLAPGEYAIVIRPPRKRLTGAVVLSEAGEGRLFRTAWVFAVK